MSLKTLEEVHVPLQSKIETKLFQNVTKILDKIPNVHPLIFNNSIIDLQAALLNYSNDAPPLGIGISVYPNKSTGTVDILALFSGNIYHAPPLVIALVSNAFIGVKPGIVPTIF